MLKKSQQIISTKKVTISKYYQQLPHQHEAISSLKVVQIKALFTKWLSSLPTEQRYLAVKVHAPELAYAVRKVYRQIEAQKINSTCRSQHSENKKFPSRLIKNFFESIVMMSDQLYLDSFGFDFNLIQSPEKLYDTLVCLSDQKDFNLTLSDLKNNKIPFNELTKLIQKSKNKDELACILATFLKQQIFSSIMQERQKQALQIQKNRKKQFTNVWKSFPQQFKRKLLLLQTHDVKQLVNLMLDKKISISNPQQIQNEFYQLLKLEKNDFCNRIFKSRFKKAHISVEDYHELIYQAWKQEVDKRKKKRNKRSKKKKQVKGKRNKSLGVQSNETNQTQIKEERPILNVEEIVNAKLNEDILAYSDQISQEANQYYDRKVQAFSRLQYLIGAYFNAPIYLFGSCACGLAIKNSDIDIAVDEKILEQFQSVSEKKKIISALQFLGGLFENRKWITNLKVIRTAAIPIINLTIDTSIPMYENFMSQQDYHRLNSSPTKGLIDVDLTIENKNQKYGPTHLGIISTKKMCGWLQQIQNLHQIAIILKYYLTLKSLNDTYKGGLKTYTLVVLIIAYLKAFKNQGNVKLQNALQGLTRFYGYDFNEQKFAIDIAGQSMNQIFYEKKQIDINSAALQVIDPINRRIMTKSCYHFSEIKKLMQKIYDTCFLKTRKQIEEFCFGLNPKTKKHQVQEILREYQNNLEGNPFGQILD